MAALRCQHCDQPLTAAEIQAGWCDNCGKRVASGLVSAAAHGGVELAPPRHASSVSEVAVAQSNALLGWGTVRAGLAQVFVGALVLAAGLTLHLLLDLNATTGVRERPGTAKLVLEFVSNRMLTIGIFLTVAGMCMGCAAPGDPGPKGWAIGVVACMALFLLIYLLQITFQIENQRVARENLERELRLPTRRVEKPSPLKRQEPPYSEGLLKALRYVREGTVWLGGILFLIFLRGVAHAFHRAGLAAHAIVYLAVFLVAAGLFVWFQIAAARGTYSREVLESLERVTLGVFTALAVWLLAVVGPIRGAVTRGLAR
jgi:hypothetical protein